jgi:hypothetical protein
MRSASGFPRENPPAIRGKTARQVMRISSRGPPRGQFRQTFGVYRLVVDAGNEALSRTPDRPFSPISNTDMEA